MASFSALPTKGTPLSASSTKALQAPGMTFYEMSLINIQFELDEVGSRIELLRKNKLIVDSELNEKVNLYRNLGKKSKRFKAILKSKYKTGDYSPSKYGLQPSTPVKRVLTPQKTTDPLTPNKLQKFDSMTPDKNVTSELLSGEDDDILLMADANGIEEGVTFDEAMSMTEGEKNCNDNSKPDKVDDNASKQDRDDKTIKHTMNLKTNDKVGKDVQRETEFDWDLKANQKIQLIQLMQLKGIKMFW